MRTAKLMGLVSLALVALFAALIAALGHGQASDLAARETLRLYADAALKAPVDAVAEAYRKEYGVRVEVEYAGSGALLGGLKRQSGADRGDLYLAASEDYVRAAALQGLSEESMSVAAMSPVVAVARGNPKAIRGLPDLLRRDVRLDWAKPIGADLGNLTKGALEGRGEWAALERHVEETGAFKATAADIADNIRVGAADAGVVWDATLKGYPGLEAVRLEVFAPIAQKITVTVLSGSRHPTAALRFARYLSARDRGLPVLAAHGYAVADGDKWAQTPELQLYSGAMLRPAIDELISRFELREGVRITRIYNGCGILVSQMKGGQRPDAYFACDVSFMTKVQDLFLPSVEVSQNPMALLVAKGNPKGIRDARDLLRPGVRVGLGHPEKAALGALTKLMFEKMDLYSPLKASGNVRVESATGDFLVNQLRTGSLDAVVVYVSNASQVHEYLDLIPIADPAALATQPYAIGKASNYRHTMERLLAALESRESQKHFEDLGFRWRATDSALAARAP